MNRAKAMHIAVMSSKNHTPLCSSYTKSVTIIPNVITAPAVELKAASQTNGKARYGKKKEGILTW